MKQSLYFFMILTSITTINAMDNDCKKRIQILEKPDKEKSKFVTPITHDAEKQSPLLQHIHELKSQQHQFALNLQTLKKTYAQFIQDLEKTHVQFKKNLQTLEDMNGTIQGKLNQIEESSLDQEECIINQQIEILRLTEQLMDQEEREMK